MKPIELSAKEEQLLKFLLKAKYTTTKQLARLYFTDSMSSSTALRRANLTTKKLNEKGYIRHLDRRIGGVRAGSGSFVWKINTKGMKYLKQKQMNLSITRQNNYEPTWHHLEHTLAISEIYVQLTELKNKHSIQSIDSFQFEPNCWRGWLDNHAGRMILKPDCYIEISLDNYLYNYFVEVDKNSESLTRIVNKSKQYIRYFNLNIEQKDTGIFPLVLWVVPDDKRKLAITRRIQEELQDYWELFQVIPLDDFKDVMLGGISDGQAD